MAKNKLTLVFSFSPKTAEPKHRRQCVCQLTPSDDDIHDLNVEIRGKDFLDFSMDS